MLRDLTIIDQRARRQGRSKISARVDMRDAVLAVLAAGASPFSFPAICETVAGGGIVTGTMKGRVRLALKKLAADGRVRRVTQGGNRQASLWEAIRK